MLKFKTSCAVLAYLSSNLLNEVGCLFFGILKQAYVCAISSLKSSRSLSHLLMSSCLNIVIALWIYLCLMVTNCSGERSFSKLKRIKNDQCLTMYQYSLNHLTLMSSWRCYVRKCKKTAVYTLLTGNNGDGSKTAKIITRQC